MKIAVIGDIHGCWDDADTSYLNASDDDLVLFTGDLPRIIGNSTMRIAQSIARLRKPYAVIAGNHDCTTLPALVGEMAGSDTLSNLQAGSIARNYGRLREVFGERLLAYSSLQAGGFTVVGARPFAMDGVRFSFRKTVERLFGVSNLAASARRIAAEIETAPGPVILLAHNGPHGLGSLRTDPFGVDFRREAGDNGDGDLAAAIADHKPKVRLVVAGHMHHRVARSDLLRRHALVRGGTWYVNGARVPRHEPGGRYYLRVETDDAKCVRLSAICYGRGAVSETEIAPESA